MLNIKEKQSMYNVQTHGDVVFTLLRHNKNKEKTEDVLNMAAPWENKKRSQDTGQTFGMYKNFVEFFNCLFVKLFI